jgi:hypothetical protein
MALPRPQHFQAQDFARFAFDYDFQRTATHFAVGGESLQRPACINRQLKALAAVRTLNRFDSFHLTSL